MNASVKVQRLVEVGRLRFELEEYVDRCKENDVPPSLDALVTLLAVTQPLGNPALGYGGAHPA